MMNKWSFSKNHPLSWYFLIGMLTAISTVTLYAAIFPMIVPIENFAGYVEIGISSAVLFAIILKNYHFNNGKIVKNLQLQNNVSISKQVVLFMAPGLWIWACYRIKKLKKGFLLYIMGFTVGGIMLPALLPFPYSFIAAMLGLPPIGIFFIIKWSKIWNSQANKK